VPPEIVVQGNTIKISWLNTSFQDLPHDATKIIIAQNAQACILTLIWSLLMPDTSGSQIHLMYLLLLTDLNNVSNFCWGSTLLACLYHALDHDIN